MSDSGPAVVTPSGFSHVRLTVTDIQRSKGLDHLCPLVDDVAALHAAARRLDAAGVEHGEVTDLPAFGLTILSLQDPDGVNLELAAPLRPA